MDNLFTVNNKNVPVDSTKKKYSKTGLFFKRHLKDCGFHFLCFLSFASRSEQQMLSYKEDHLLFRASLQQIALRESEERSQDEKERIRIGEMGN